MGIMTVRNIPEGLNNALKERAKLHNRSTEAEVRAILEEAVLHSSRIQLGNALAGLSKQLGLTNEDFESLGELRANEPADPMKFEQNACEISLHLTGMQLLLEMMLLLKLLESALSILGNESSEIGVRLTLPLR